MDSSVAPVIIICTIVVARNTIVTALAGTKTTSPPTIAVTAPTISIDSIGLGLWHSVANKPIAVKLLNCNKGKKIVILNVPPKLCRLGRRCLTSVGRIRRRSSPTPPARHLRNRVFTISIDSNKISQKNPVSNYPPIKNKTTINTQNCQQLFYIFNADGETRTRKDIMPHAPQACAYTNSATSALF